MFLPSFSLRFPEAFAVAAGATAAAESRQLLEQAAVVPTCGRWSHCVLLVASPCRSQPKRRRELTSMGVPCGVQALTGRTCSGPGGPLWSFSRRQQAS